MMKHLAKKEYDIHRTLVEKCLTGDRRAQFELYTLYSGAMLNVAYRMLGSREDAEDILQEAFVDAFTKLSDFRFEASFGSWIKRIVVNRCINRTKSRKQVLTFIDDYGFMQIADDECHDEECEMTVAKIKEGITTLPEGSRMVFNLYLFEGYAHAQIAEMLGISESTSKTQYRYAKLKLREYLKHVEV
jgi:RNA polymerase sigma factor (sigma-70 family)